ncbi:NAD(P)/FAD-dependent oxidoreductase [Portibacter marinus]|uniref:NAD(P)/FAD-dependent oxidoreductase n=1 Tax=Portibacter marinus TaxID=2898660 RepID=UPI001F3C1CCA|nr:FAD-dependent oxidoreductase [Portibacter marinus]
MTNDDKTCVIVGASHAGVNCSFALRREGWKGNILLIDADPHLPYHRPPLSKSFLKNADHIDHYALKPLESYQRENITLQLGRKVIQIDRENRVIVIEGNDQMKYDQLVLATGASAIIPYIPGLLSSDCCFAMRTAEDAFHIKAMVENKSLPKVVVIGGGYIGLEIAASLKHLGAEITVLEKEDRILSRVTSPYISDFFMQLHGANGVNIETQKNVIEVETFEGDSNVKCEDGSSYEADVIIIGVGIQVNATLAEQSGLASRDGIVVDTSCRTSDEHIYAVGDCTRHYNPYYKEELRLECVQNAVDQAKVAAANICGIVLRYDAVPWFWSDQYDVKLQIAGLSKGYDEVMIRMEQGENRKCSAWYFKDHRLLAVDAINNAKAYVMGTKAIKSGLTIDKEKLKDATIPIKEAFSR